MNQYAKEIVDRIKDPKWAILFIVAIAVVAFAVKEVNSASINNNDGTVTDIPKGYKYVIYPKTHVVTSIPKAAADCPVYPKCDQLVVGPAQQEYPCIKEGP